MDDIKGRKVSQPAVTDDDLLQAIKCSDTAYELPAGKVLVATARTGGQRKYHTDPECQYVTDSHTEWDREMAEGWGFDQCGVCDGGTYGGGSPVDK